MKEETLKIWCETCEGSGQVYQEHQVGITGSGGHFDCPDCDGKGYLNTSRYRLSDSGDNVVDISPKPETANVRDGVIKKGDKVWWRAFGGPERIDSADDAHWRNILNHPHAYQISKPEFIGNYLD